MAPNVSTDVAIAVPGPNDRQGIETCACRAKRLDLLDRSRDRMTVKALRLLVHRLRRLGGFGGRNDRQGMRLLAVVIGELP